MEPITGTMAIMGLATSLFGAGGSIFSGNEAAGYAAQEAQVSQQITGLQQQENEQRRLIMQVSARRQSTEALRQAQMRASASLAAGTNQGAQFGSGVAGGRAQATNEGNYNLQGINQNLQVGNQLFDLQNRITGQQGILSQLQGQQASAQGQAAMFSGISSIGGSLSSAAGPMGNILGNWFGNNNDPTAGPGMPKMGALYNQ